MSNVLNNETLVQYVNTDHAIFYVKEIFKNCIDVDPALMVEVRKIGLYHLADGTTSPAEQSTTAQLLQFDQADPIPGLANWVAQQCVKTAPLGIGTFLAPALLNDRRANDISVQLMATVCADFDTGNPAAQLDELCKRMGHRPTFVCTSGGTTKEGHPKLHAHWRLDEPCSEPWKVAYIREQIALLYGADTSFKRIPQIIRIPGALYDKQGKWGTTLIIEHNDNETGLLDWEEALGVDWQNIRADSIHNIETRGKSKEERSERKHQLQTEVVEEGRTADTRWDRFSEYAGHQIRQARFQHQTIDEALISTKIWVHDKMVPAWETERIENEFRALLQRDKVNHEEVWGEHGKPPITFGNLPVAAAPPPGALPIQAPAAPPPSAPVETVASAPVWELDMFSADSLYAGEAPPERHLIENFIVHQSSLALVADGGVGKTYISLELALRAAAGPDYPNNTFLGFAINECMNVVVFTVEDGQQDIHRRVCAIDTDGSLRKAAGKRCVIVPVQEQIMDGLTLAEKDGKGNFGPSKAWRELQRYIEEYLAKRAAQNMKYPLLVIIDTYSATHHGDENNATGTNEWFRAAGLLRKFEATLMVTHHVRKADPKMEIRTASDMKAAVRGSSAFLNSLRTVYGIWEMPNGDAVLKEVMREKGSRLFNAGILKNNTGIDWNHRSDPRYPDPMITLRRLGTGRLIFDDEIHLKRIELTAGKGERMARARAQLRAAIIHAVRWYAEQSWPLSERNIMKDKEQFLPPTIRDMARDKEVEPMLKKLIGDGTVRQITIKGRVGGGMILDVPEGPYFTQRQSERRSDNPAMQWSHFKYDEEHEEYVALENVQTMMDLERVKT